MTMDLKWLETFIVAAKTENFRIAAEKLHLSQPSITVHIHQLEQFLDVKLFMRENNRVALTKEGKQFLIEAQKMLESIESGVKQFKVTTGQIKEPIVGVISPLLVETTLPHVLYHFGIHNPQYDLSILIEESAKIEEMIASKKAHIGISLFPSKHRQTKSELLLESPLELVVPLDEYDDETGMAIDIEQLFNEYSFFINHILSVSDEINHQIKLYFPSMKTISISQSYIVKRFIKDGLGISFLPKMITRREMMEGRFNVIPFSHFELPTVQVFLLMKKDYDVSNDLVELIKTSYIG